MNACPVRGFGLAYAAPHGRIEGGAVFHVADREVFLFRKPEAPLFASTFGYTAPPIPSRTRSSLKTGRFQKIEGEWRDMLAGSVFSVERGFGQVLPERGATRDRDDQDALAPRRLSGFDTFWYIWASTFEDVVILE